VRDSFHAAETISHGIEWVATFDAGFDRMEGIPRFDLTATS
jgi:predicted nucleic acid-binding protein